VCRFVVDWVLPALNFSPVDRQLVLFQQYLRFFAATLECSNFDFVVTKIIQQHVFAHGGRRHKCVCGDRRPIAKWVETRHLIAVKAQHLPLKLEELECLIEA
jgi:hypothetical protein